MVSREHLRKLTFSGANTDGLSAVVQQFLMAAAQNASINYLKLDMMALPFEALTAFFRVNRTVKTLLLTNVSVTTANQDHTLEEDLQRDALQILLHFCLG